MHLLISTFTALLSLHASHGLYQHQIGTYDWYRKGIGPVQYAGFDRSSVIVATSSAVLASIEIATNELVWRQVLPENEPILGMLCNEDIIYAVLGPRSQPNLSIWSAKDGSLKAMTRSLSASQLENHDNLPLRIVKTSSLIVVWSSNVVHAFDAVTAEIRYSMTIPHSSIEFISCRGPAVNLIDILSKDDSGDLVFDTADQTGSFVRSNKITIDDMRIVPLSGNRALIISSTFVQEVVNGDVGDKIVFGGGGAGALPDASVLDASLIELKFSSGRRVIVDLKRNTTVEVTSSESIQKELFSEGFQLMQTLDKIIVSKATTMICSVPFSLDEYGLMSSVVCNNEHCFVSTADGSFSCIKLANQSVSWTRFEAIALPQQVIMVDAPTQQLLTSLDHFPSFWPRLSIQYDSVRQFLSDSVSAFSSISESSLFASENALPFDNSSFGMKKIVLILSKRRLFALCGLTGLTLWSFSLLPYQLSDSNYINLFSLPDIVLIAGPHALHIDLMSGRIIAHTRFTAPVAVAVEYPLSVSPSSSFLSISLISGEVIIFPKSRIPEVFEVYPNGYYFNKLSVTNKTVEGFHTVESQKRARNNLIWRYQFPSDTTICAWTCSNLKEVVPVPATVISSDQILFKYLNRPFRVLLTASGSTLSLLAIDGLSGNVLYRNEHPHCAERSEYVHATVIENVIVYSFFNSRDMLFNLATVELFHNSPAAAQAFVFPNRICSLGFTETLRGVTTKQIIIGMCTGQLFVTPVHRLTCDPSFRQAHPLISINPLSIINYDRVVNRIHTIVASGTELESTTIVASVGLDAFTTRTHPSRPFDLLNSDFNFPLLLTTVSAVATGILISSRMARRKQRFLKWL